MNEFDRIRNWIVAWLERELNVPTGSIACDESLLNYGMDSVNAIMLVGDLENQLKLRLSPTLVWDHPSVNSIAQAVLADVAAPTNGLPTDERRAGEDSKLHALSQQEAETLLDNIDSLSDEQIDELLARLNRG